MSTGHGFTLIELMVTVAVAAILAAVAVPGYQYLVRNNRMSATINDLVTDLHRARNEAIRRGLTVTICHSTDGRRCGSDWSSGWIMFVDASNIGKRNQSSQAGEPLLQVHGALPAGATLDGGANFPNYIAYSALGFSNNNGTFTFCDARGAPHARAVIISKTGRTRIAHTASDGDSLSCP